MSKAALVLDLLIALTERQVRLQNLLRTAAAEGRDVSDDELSGLRAEDDQAAANLDQAIADAHARENGG